MKEAKFKSLTLKSSKLVSFMSNAISEPTLAGSVELSGCFHAAYMNGTPIGKFRTAAQAEAAVHGVSEWILAQGAPAEAPAETPSQDLPRGIYPRGRRFYVHSPIYLGSFPTLAAAMQAQTNYRQSQASDRQAARELRQTKRSEARLASRSAQPTSQPSTQSQPQPNPSPNPIPATNPIPAPIPAAALKPNPQP